MLRSLRASHQKVFDHQGRMIDSLFEQLAAVRETQDEMAKLFAADNDLDDLIDRDEAGEP